MKRTFALLLVLVMVAALFVGCSPAGTYHVETIDGKKPHDYYIEELKSSFHVGDDDVKELLERLKVDEDDLKDPIKLELKKDGTYLVKSLIDGTEEEGKWKKDGKTIILTANDAEDDDEPTELTIKGGKLIMKKDADDDKSPELVFAKGK